MDILQHLAQAAAVILLLELLVVLLIFLAVSGGLAFGLRWGRGKLSGVFGTVNGFLPKVTGYVHTGTDYAAKPFILAGGLTAKVRGTAGSVRGRVRSLHAPASAPDIEITAARPISPPPEAESPTEAVDTLV